MHKNYPVYYGTVCYSILFKTMFLSDPFISMDNSKSVLKTYNLNRGEPYSKV